MTELNRSCLREGDEWFNLPRGRGYFTIVLILQTFCVMKILLKVVTEDI